MEEVRMRKNDSFSEAEFRMLLSGESGKDEPLELFDLDDRKLLQALVRIRKMIDDLVSGI
jgi:hypothetical protein